jgi:uncharacterized protein (DUF433 family)
LSFANLIEARVLRSLRSDHRVSVKDLRTALAYAQDELRIDRLLLRPELTTEPGRVFLDHYGQLIELSASGQLAMRKLLEAHPQRIEWDESRFPIRLFPFVSTTAATGERPLAIDPRIAFGRPLIRSKSISTAIIAGRNDAGETVDEVAADYDLNAAEVEQAALYERAA